MVPGMEIGSTAVIIFIKGETYSIGSMDLAKEGNASIVLKMSVI